MKKVLGGIVYLILGILLIVAAVALFVHDAEYIFTGNTVSLNEILENGEELPRDKYVTYTCTMPLGNYAETREYLGGIIPLPISSQQYAMLDESGMILSAEINKKSKITEMEDAAEAFFDDEAVTVTIEGCFEINGSRMDDYLQEYIGYFMTGEEMDEEGIFLTSYAVNTTKTRVSQVLLYVSVAVIGVAIIVASVVKRRIQ